MSSPLSVIISGCHAGPNPSPGLGIARSLRLAFPDAHLIGRDFSAAATGLHAAVFDEVWLCPPWEQADLGLLREQLLPRLDQAWFISGLDTEVSWLAELEHARILGPPSRALRAASKPGVAAASQLPVRVPAWRFLAAGERAVHSFCRRHDWQVWVKGSVHESRRVRTWSELQAAAAELGATWGAEELYVQAHVAGPHVSVAYAALGGELLDAVLLEKLGTTSEGKAWSGTIRDVPDLLFRALRDVLRSLTWTGGGELEFVRDAAGTLWLFDWNPRFPAWIHGATLAGHNLPGQLLARASGVPAIPPSNRATQFVRVVTEIPTRPGVILSRPEPSTQEHVIGAKHPSGMPALSRRLRSPSSSRAQVASGLPGELAADLAEAVASLGQTPARALLRRSAQRQFDRARKLTDQHRIALAYSVKTNPDAAIMQMARAAGCMAEVISLDELNWAITCGFPVHEIIYNGPVPLPRRDPSTQALGAVFADMTTVLAAYLAMAPAGIVGVRLRPPGVHSRFGVPVEDPGEFESLSAVLRAAPPGLPLGISFHVASSEVGLNRWQHLARQVGEFALALSEVSGKTVSMLNLGGGWTAEDFSLVAPQTLQQLAEWLRTKLGAELAVLIEPGKALAGPAQAVLTRVVDIRRTPEGHVQAVMDAGVSDVPQVPAFPHRLAILRAGATTLLGEGEDQLLGPTCMETDRLADGIALPSDLEIGEVLAILDAGAYDASMAYRFARGGSRAR